MNVREKILLVQLLLEDIRGNWGHGAYGRNAEDRALKAKSLCEEIASETNNEDYSFLADFCKIYIDSSKDWGDWDGRFFREPFPRGYTNMEKLHGLKETYKDKSKNFQSVAKEYLTYPWLRFSDWGEDDDE